MSKAAASGGGNSVSRSLPAQERLTGHVLAPTPPLGQCAQSVLHWVRPTASATRYDMEIYSRPGNPLHAERFPSVGVVGLRANLHAQPVMGLSSKAARSRRAALGALAAAVGACSGGAPSANGTDGLDGAAGNTASSVTAPSGAAADGTGGGPQMTGGGTATGTANAGNGAGTGGGSVTLSEGPFLAPTGAAVRLTQSELNNILLDVLGDTEAAATTYLSEDEYSPFDNDATRQTVSPALIDSLHALSEAVAERATSEAQRDTWMPCTPQSAEDTECFDQTVRTLGRRLFRRAIDDDELASYRGLMDFGVEQADFFTSVQLLLTALLQDPEFLYRTERGTERGGATTQAGVLDLNGYEVATRMAFLLWGSTADDALLTAAEEGQLATASSRREVARDLLSHSRAQSQLHRFHGMWLGYRTLPHGAALNAQFQAETEHLIERVVFDEPSAYLDLFRSDQTYLTESLAEHYRLPAPNGGSGEGWVTYPDDAGRAGILSHGSVLSAFSKFSDTSPTQRGIFVRTRLMCLGVPTPPATINVDQPPPEVQGGCKLDRYRAHREQSGCAECHSLFEPIGIGLENFDLAGRYRDSDDDNPDCKITETGTLPGYGDFRGPAELSALLLDNQLIAQCFSQHYLRFAWAKGALSAPELAFSAELSQALEQGGAHLDEWLLDLVAHESFGRKTAPMQESP